MQRPAHTKEWHHDTPARGHPGQPGPGQGPVRPAARHSHGDPARSHRDRRGGACRRGSGAGTDPGSSGLAGGRRLGLQGRQPDRGDGRVLRHRGRFPARLEAAREHRGSHLRALPGVPVGDPLAAQAARRAAAHRRLARGRPRAAPGPALPRSPARVGTGLAAHDRRTARPGRRRTCRRARAGRGLPPLPVWPQSPRRHHR